MMAAATGWNKSQPSAAAGEFAMLDLAQSLERMGGDEDLLREIAALFLDDAPDLLAKIRTAAERRDPNALQTAAHTLKGCVANFGARPAFEAALALEMAGRNGDFDGAGSALARLQEALDRLAPELSSLLQA